MNPQLDHLVMSSFKLFIEHEILKYGAAHFPISTYFYPTQNLINGLNTYSAPFKPIIGDNSISNITGITGVYLNDTLVGLGISGFSGINYAEGWVYFTGNMAGNTISGNYSVPEFNVSLTSKPEEELLFETKFNKRPRTLRQATGLSSEETTYPIVYLKNDGGSNAEWAFGGVEDTNINIKGIVIADSQFNLDGVCSIFRDTNRKYVALISGNQMPFNALGDYRSGVAYNYDSLIASKLQTNNSFYIDDINVLGFSRYSKILGELKSINPEIYPALIEWNVSIIRTPRS